MFAYCNNTPINAIDTDGHVIMYISIHDDLFLNMFFGAGGNGGGGGYAFTCASSAKDKIMKMKAFVNNTSEKEVQHNLREHGMSFYKGVLVMKTPFDASFSCGIIGISKDQMDSNTLNHEYGHTVQLENMGLIKYVGDVVIPSVTINILDRNGKLPYDYFSYPWEAEAIQLGGSSLSQSWKPALQQGEYTSYWDLIQLFFQ